MLCSEGGKDTGFSRCKAHLGACLEADEEFVRFSLSQRFKVRCKNQTQTKVWNHFIEKSHTTSVAKISKCDTATPQTSSFYISTLGWFFYKQALSPHTQLYRDMYSILECQWIWVQHRDQSLSLHQNSDFSCERYERPWRSIENAVCNIRHHSHPPQLIQNTHWKPVTKYFANKNILEN